MTDKGQKITEAQAMGAAANENEILLFEAWFQAVWLGDEEHGQRVPTAISDPLYPTYLEQHQLALGAWMHRAALAQPVSLFLTPERIQQEWDAFIDYPDPKNKLYVTTTSALIFARTIAQMAAANGGAV